MAISVISVSGVKFRAIDVDSLFTFEDNLYVKTDQDIAVVFIKQTMSILQTPVVFDLDTKVRRVKQISVLEE